ncbi:MAG: PKD domain-containing protein [Deltaproteobacteria bacterium]|nr:PKD domain-containing protein [Deltaproteobacteria bacterium]
MTIHNKMCLYCSAQDVLVPSKDELRQLQHNPILTVLLNISCFFLLKVYDVMKKSIGSIILMLILLFPGLTMATDVGGIINTDTVWEFKNSPIKITSDVQIANSVTLTIEPGVVVNGFGKIRVWGTLNAIGTDALNINFNEVFIIIEGNATNGVVHIQFGNFISGNGIMEEAGTGSRRLTLLDSKLENDSIVLAGPTGDCHIERNIFVNTDWNLFGAAFPNVKVYIRNNLFYQWRDESAVFLANYSGLSNSKIIFENNSFLTTDKIAIKDGTPADISVPGYTFNPIMIVANNYWGTIDTSIIDSMIYDRNDDLNHYTYFTYKPFLTEPHPDTPTLFKAPTANFTANTKTGTNRLTVNFNDQSKGNITSRLWNFGDGGISTDRNPYHTYTNPGIFTVSLKVVGPGGSDLEIKPDFITIAESKSMAWIPLLLPEN